MPSASFRSFLALTALLLAAPGVAQTPTPNPFFQEWTTPFGMPPFDRITADHFKPAYEAAMMDQRKEVEAIATNPQPPTFANSIEALENSDLSLSRVNGVFFTLTGAETNDALQAINKEIAPKLSALNDDVLLNERLFARVKAVWQERETLSLSVEQKKLLEDTYKEFVRGGANLSGEQKQRFREINQELSVLGLKFADNLLKETNSFKLVIDRKRDVAGLPPAVVAAAANAAKAAKLEGKWVFTLHAPSIWPFMTFAEDRELRKKVLDAYTTRADHGDVLDNKTTLSRIAALRSERARLLGYKTHADFVLEENMAKTPAGVYGLLDRLWPPSLAMAKRERADLDAALKTERKNATLEAWDWRYYSEIVRRARFDLDDQALRPYFPLDRVREGAFYTANRLYGLTFTERADVPKYHPDVRVFEVKDADGSFLALYTVDYHSRPGKRSGAWCGRIRPTWVKAGRDVRPIVTNVTNFTAPAGDTPALLSLEEVRTLFHEFGHAINGFLSRVTYRTMNRTSRDFVELPSQIMESWALEPEVLKVYAKHWKTGETIPLALVSKIEKAGTYGEGFRMTEYLAATFLDMDWHTLTQPQEMDASAFEKASLARTGLIPEIVVRYRSPYFQHIFGPGFGYSAGYYSYIWSDVLVADAYDAFREKGIFDKETATSFRKNILEKGGTEEAMTLYKRFRGREPAVEPLLVKRGLAERKPTGTS